MLAASRPGGRLLELGTGVGVGTAWLLSGMTDDARLMTVELEQALSEHASALLRDDRVEFRVGDGEFNMLRHNLTANGGLYQQGVVVEAQLARRRGRGNAQFAKHAAPVKPVAAVFTTKVQQGKLQQRLGRQGQGSLTQQLRAAHREHFFTEQPMAFALFEAAITEQHRHVDIGT